jgi:uncharacterized membrane protein SirB2
LAAREKTWTAMDYFTLKYSHMLLALVSISGFVLRWWWLQSGSALLAHRLTRVVPHVVDSLFLLTGIWLTFVIHQYPIAHHWLTAKVIGLVVYIVLGSLALKRARTANGRKLAFVAALIVFAWIASVARTRTVAGFLS